jgi:hypothetical protein
VASLVVYYLEKLLSTDKGFVFTTKSAGKSLFGAQ